MAALTAVDVHSRIRSVCAHPSFGLIEAVQWADFELQPETNIDGVYRVPPLSSQGSRGGFNFSEDRDETVQIWVARKRNATPYETAALLASDVHSLTSAVMRDAHQVSGDYSISDEGRGHTIEDVPAADYLRMRLTLAVNYDAVW